MTVGILLFVVFFILLLIGLPVSISMALSTLVALTIAGYPTEQLPSTLVQGVQSYTLLAIPFFILAAYLMNSTGITQRIFEFSEAVVGHIKGGLAQVNIIASVIFAGISGTSSGDQAGLGAIEVKAMVGKGYERPFTAAITLASSAIGSIIPPSVSLIIYSYLADVSVAKLFTAGVIPGLLIALSLMIYVYIGVKTGKIVAPPEKPFSSKKLIKTFKNGFFALLAPIIILGGILGGIVTPTEAGVLAAVYAIICALIYRELNFKLFKDAVFDTVKSTSMIMFLVAVGVAMSWIVSAEQLPALVSNSLIGLTENPYLMLLIINIALLLLGMVMEGIPIKLIMVPILLPIIDSLGIDRIHFGIVMSFNILIGAMTPPVGLGLYIMSSVGNLPIEQLIKAILPFYIPLIIALIIITFIPPLSLLLPDLLFDF